MIASKTYYVVDDDIDDQLFLVQALTENDPSIQCFTASSGQEAIAVLKNASLPFPDAIFLDLNMPRLNGKECLTEIKRTIALRDIPVIIYSTSSDQVEIHELMKMGAAYFLIKKSRFKELKTELSAMLISLDHPEMTSPTHRYFS